MGSEEAIRRNDALIAALEIAPNVLYARYNQFGQVSRIFKCLLSRFSLRPLRRLMCWCSLRQIGVLAWCSEFEEMVNEIKALGFSHEMAGPTRDRALEACREVLKLDLDIPAQLINMYLVRFYHSGRCHLSLSDGHISRLVRLPGCEL